MRGNKMTICIAGKNQCAIDALKFVNNKYSKFYDIIALINSSDKGRDSWQYSFKKFAKKNNIKIVRLNDIYNIKNLYFFSLEYEKIVNTKNFISKNLYNIHFSLLPKYRGCHTNFFQIFNGEKYSGVTLHQIDNGIDTGNLISQIRFKIPINATAYENYLKLMKYAVILLKRNITKILSNNYKSKKQDLNKGSYYNRSCVDYSKLSIIKKIDNNINLHNHIRSLIFPPLQLPKFGKKFIIKSIFKNKKIQLKFKR